MDPLSITASVIAIGTAARGAATCLRKVAKLKGLPAAISALWNEVSDLRVLVEDIKSLLMTDRGRFMCAESPPTPGLTSLKTSLDFAKDTLDSLESVINTQLRKKDGSVDRVSWLRLENTAKKLQQDLRLARSNATASLSLLTSATNFHIQTQLEGLQDMSLGSQAFVSYRTEMQSSMTTMAQRQERNENTLNRLEAHLCGERVAVAASPALKAVGQTSLPLTKPQPTSLADFRADSVTSPLALKVSHPSRCDFSCRCKCHLPRSFHSPARLKPFLGVLYGGYVGIPALKPPCTYRRCNGTAIGRLEVTYVFPAWFVARAVSLALKMDPLDGPELNIRTYRTRPYMDPIFSYVYDQYVDKLQDLIVRKAASVLDVTSDNGHSALHIAMRVGQMKAVHLLLQCGAEQHLENHFGETPYDMAWNSILCFRNTPNAALFHVDDLLHLFPSPDMCEEKRKFTIIHKVVLGLLYIDLDVAISMDVNLVNQGDADGRTPVSWAAARGDGAAVRSLLKYGADPDQVDFIGQGPLRSSMKAESPECMQLLLDARANVNITDDWEQTCLIAAHYYPEPHRFVPGLLEAGANVNAREINGATALVESVYRPGIDYSASAELLIRAGANMDIQNNLGMAFIHRAIMHNAHGTLKAVLFIAKPDWTLVTNNGEGVLHYAARYADIETLEILRQAEPENLDVNTYCSNGRTALHIAEARRQQTRMAPTPLDEEKGLEKSSIALTDWDHAWGELLEFVRVVKSPSAAPVPFYLHGSTNGSQDSFYSYDSWHSALADFAPL